MREKITANILFSGIGCQERGINNTNLFDLEVLSTSDINKDALVSYATIHCGLTDDLVNNYNYPSRKEMAKYLTDLNIGYQPDKDKYYNWFKLANGKSNSLQKYYLACILSNQKGDINRITELPYADLWTISFCCQDISVAGKMKGFAPDSNTRSSLLWKNIELLKHSVDKGESPKYLMFENVKNLISKKFINDFNNLLNILDELGFNTYWQVLNGKECGVPHSRERVFVISIRKDIDKGNFEFPKPFDNGVRLRDLFETNVDNKYYLSDEMIKRFKSIHNIKDIDINSHQIGIDKSINQTSVIEYANCITAGEDRGVSNRQSEGTAVLEIYDDFELNQIGHISNTNSLGNRVYSDNICRTLISEAGGGGAKTGWYQISNSTTYSIRKLTPIECWRLMGFTTEDCINVKNMGISDTNLYKQAGNGIITNCVELIMEHLYKAQYDETYICSDEKIINNKGDN